MEHIQKRMTCQGSEGVAAGFEGRAEDWGDLEQFPAHAKPLRALSREHEGETRGRVAGTIRSATWLSVQDGRKLVKIAGDDCSTMLMMVAAYRGSGCQLGEID